MLVEDDSPGRVLGGLGTRYGRREGFESWVSALNATLVVACMSGRDYRWESFVS